MRRWFGVPVHRYGSEKYKDTWDVFERARYIAGVNGAKCTTVLKKQVAERVERVSDLNVFGFHASKRAREQSACGQKARRSWAGFR